MAALPEHHYAVTIDWVGNRGTGTSGYHDFSRDHTVASGNAPLIAGSADPAFRGDAQRWNPEQLLVAAVSQCHMLWYLHVCATNGVVVEEYHDEATGTMTTHPDGSGEFTEVTLHPHVIVREPGMVERAEALHAEVPALCFIARSVNFPVHHSPTVVVASDRGAS